MNKKLLIGLFSLFIFFGCAKKEDEAVDTALNNLFFDVVYNTKFYRTIGSSAWKNVEGLQQIKFNNSLDENATIETSSGTFTVFYNNYKEIGLFNSNLCSGGYEGSFISTAKNGDSCTPNQIYNPNDPYNPCIDETEEESPNIDPVTGQELPKDLYEFSFQLSVSRRSLATGCNVVNPLEVVNYDVIRFTNNGDLIVKDFNRNIEFYMQPDVR